MKKALFLGLFLASVAVIGLILLQFGTIREAKADENVNLKLKLEASVDKGDSWHNFSGDTNSEGESVTAQPGDVVWLRLKTWNEDQAFTASNVNLVGSYTNADYVASGSATDVDEDNDGTSYSGALINQGAGIGVITVGPNGSESANYQSMIIKARLADDFPVGRTVIKGTMMISDEGESGIAGLIGLKKVLAAGLGNQSTVRVVVNVAEEIDSLPQTGSRN